MAKIVNLSKEIFTFKEKVAKQANPIKYYIDENGCHICISHALDKDGYPRVHRFGKDLRMSRYVWPIANDEELQMGEDIIMHSCDNPQCINPEHLKRGTQQENMADMRSKGRLASGSKHGMAKLDESKVYFIRFEAGELSNSELAGMLNVSETTVRDIMKNKTWKHVKEEMIHLSMNNNQTA